jgi:predicted nucleic acid-binding protein
VNGAAWPLVAVLDTNVWLDVLVFADPAAAPIAQALADGRLLSRIDGHGRREFAHTVGRRLGRWQLDAEARRAACAALDRLSQPWPAAAAANAATPPVAGTRRDGGCVQPAAPAGRPCVPRCRDVDDQPFLELAATCGARWLLSRDRDLLRLARRTTAFEILSPTVAARLLAAATSRPAS